MNNNELISICEHNGKNVVNARELHAFLESKQQFADWIKNRIDKYDLVEGVDYQRIDINTVITNTDDRFINLCSGINQDVMRGGSNKVEYALSIDAAKELSMVEGNEKGKRARRYFIECERRLKESGEDTLAFMEATLRHLREQRKELSKVKQDVDILKAKEQTRPDYFSIVGYCTLHKISIDLINASAAGKAATKICRERNLQIGKVTDPRFGQVNLYPAEVLDEIFHFRK